MTIRRGYVDGPLGQLHYCEMGDGEPIILLGGAPRSGRQFEPMFSLLAARGFRSIAPDMYGFGNSAALPDGCTMEDIAAGIAALLDTLGIARATLFGLHSGAKVAASLSADRPERVNRLIVAGKSHSLVPELERRNESMLAVVRERYFAYGADLVDGPEALRGWAAMQRTLSMTVWDDSLFRLPDPSATIAAIEAKLIDDLQARRTVRTFYAANFTFDFSAALARTTAPALILEITSDAEDRSPGRQAERLAAMAPTAVTATLPEIESAGLFLHTGFVPMADAIASFHDPRVST